MEAFFPNLCRQDRARAHPIDDVRGIAGFYIKPFGSIPDVVQGEKHASGALPPAGLENIQQQGNVYLAVQAVRLVRLWFLTYLAVTAFLCTRYCTARRRTRKSPKREFMDRLTPARRSALMARVASKHTVPGLGATGGPPPRATAIDCTRAISRETGLDVPGDAEGNLRARMLWHGHARCKFGRAPLSNLAYWLPKLMRTQKRDRAAVRALRREGWAVLVIWQCQTRDVRQLERRLAKFLKSRGA